MAYDPTTWVDDVTPVSAAKLNKIEQRLAEERCTTGSFSDTTTLIAPGATYIKTIPLGTLAKSGTCFILGAMSYGSIIFFNTDPLLSRALRNYYNGDLFLVSSGVLFGSNSNGVVHLTSCYIDGTDLKLVFYNDNTESSSPNISTCTWEVQA